MIKHLWLLDVIRRLHCNRIKVQMRTGQRRVLYVMIRSGPLDILRFGTHGTGGKDCKSIRGAEFDGAA
jgi:hypothetical protein